MRSRRRQGDLVVPTSYVGRDTLLLDTVFLLYAYADAARQSSLSQAQQTRQNARRTYLDVLASRGRQVRSAGPAGARTARGLTGAPSGRRDGHARSP